MPRNNKVEAALPVRISHIGAALVTCCVATFFPCSALADKQAHLKSAIEINNEFAGKGRFFNCSAWLQDKQAKAAVGPFVISTSKGEVWILPSDFEPARIQQLRRSTGLRAIISLDQAAPIPARPAKGEVPLVVASEAVKGISALFSRVATGVKHFRARVAGFDLAFNTGAELGIGNISGTLGEFEAGGVAIAFLRITDEQGATDTSQLKLALAERLYEGTFKRDPASRFSIIYGSGKQAVSGKAATSQASVLKSIALTRECYAANASIADTAVWKVPSLTVAQLKLAEDEAAITVKADGADLSNAWVTFFRAPHDACTIAVSKAGIGRCKLIDTHGHPKGETAEEHDHFFIATFSGSVSPSVIVLPMTLRFQQ